VNARFLNKLDFGVNYTLAKFDFDQESDPDFAAGFNTPEHKFKVSLGGQDLFGHFGFNVNVRYSDEYLWQATIANAVIPERTVVDAQVNFSVPEIKSMFKFGASNLGGAEYQSAVGAPFIGSQYFFSWVINQ
jgi:outer membrane receptor protein involved in Fe transport